MSSQVSYTDIPYTDAYPGKDAPYTDAYPVIVVGAGPAGLAACAGAFSAGASRVLLLDREASCGGILNQCIHDGFGIIRYGQQLSGPEYAARGLEEAATSSGLCIMTSAIVTEVRVVGAAAAGHPAPAASGGHAAAAAPDAPRLAVTVLSAAGRQVFGAGAVVLATGCRERTRGMISIPGSRPAGIFTAGVVQNLMNRRNVMPGKEVVILGSGDIGLIMARRLTLEGAHVKAVVEIMDEPQGLARNVRQCVQDYGIPLYTSHTVSNIYGKKRLSSVDISKVDDQLRPIAGTVQNISCDTLVLSVGLIPENEVAETAGVSLDARTNGARTDEFLETNIPGIFACGNCRAVMDLADLVSVQGEAAGANAARRAAGLPLQPWVQQQYNAARKGMPVPGTVTCTLCPNGCQITAVCERGEWSVSGNRCPKGKDFAITEMTRPQRILTSTVRLAGAAEPLLAVRTDRPVPLDQFASLMPIIRKTTAHAPVEEGEVLVRNFGGTGADLIAETSAGLQAR